MIRNTSQKQLILATIAKMYHPSAEELYEQLKKIDQSIGRATVYRNVSNLADKGYLMRIKIPNSADRYEIDTKKHSHFRCDKCGQIFDIAYVPNIDCPVSDEYEIKDVSILFTGICQCCKKKKEEKEGN